MKKLTSLLLTMLMLFALTLPASAESPYYQSMKLAKWGYGYEILMSSWAESLEEPLDMPNVLSGHILYTLDSFTTGYSGTPVLNGGTGSSQNTVSLGMGVDMTEEELWYVSLTFSPEASSATFAYSSMAMVLACMANDMQIPEGMDWVDFATDICETLISAPETAIEYDGLVFVYKELEGGSRLMCVDSLAYYNDFYYNTIENYLLYE